MPSIPPKKSIGNKDLIFIQQRRYYLERFFRNISKFGFLVNSTEFRAFSRPSGLPIDRALEKLPVLTPSQTYDRIKEAINIDESSFSYADREKFATRITEFTFFIKKAKPFLLQMKVDLATFLTNKAD